MMPVVLSWWDLLGLAALGVACGFVLGAVAMWHPDGETPIRPEDIARAGDAFAQGFKGAISPPRTPGPRRAGYLTPGPNAGCYEPDWPAPGDTFSEISAGFDQLERNVIAQTQPFGRIRP